MQSEKKSKCNHQVAATLRQNANGRQKQSTCYHQASESLNGKYFNRKNCLYIQIYKYKQYHVFKGEPGERKTNMIMPA